MSVTWSALVRWQVVCLSALALCVGRRAAAEPTTEEKAACVAAHVRVQEERQAGHLVSALRALDGCSTDACPPLVRNDCIAWAEAWPKAIPSIILAVRDAKQVEQARARIVIDGADAGAALDGRPIALDPGPHRLEITLEDGTKLKKTVVLAEGEQARRVALEPPAPPSGRFPNAAVWVPLSSIAGLGTILFATFAGLGKSKEGELDDCAPDCQAPDVAEMRRLYLTADVSLGVGAAAAAALALYFGIGAAIAPSEKVVARFGVAPTLHGPTLGVSLSF